MQSIQLTFNDLLIAKKEIKEIKKEYKDILAQDNEYQEILAKMQVLKEQKKQHEFSAQADMGSRWNRLEELKVEENKLKEMITDISITNLMNGKSEEVRDEYDNLYIPNYNVNYKNSK